MRTTISKLTKAVGTKALVAVKAGNGWLQRRWCGLWGHDALLTLDRGRMALRCSTCGHETPGWDLADLKPPKPGLPGIPRRHRIRPAKMARVS